MLRMVLPRRRTGQCAREKQRQEGAGSNRLPERLQHGHLGERQKTEADHRAEIGNRQGSEQQRRAGFAGFNRCGVEEQGVIRTDGEDQEHAHQVQNIESLSRQRESGRHGEHGEQQRHQHAGHPACRAQYTGQQNDDDEHAQSRQTQRLREITRVKRIGLRFKIQHLGVGELRLRERGGNAHDIDLGGDGCAVRVQRQQCSEAAWVSEDEGVVAGGHRRALEIPGGDRRIAALRFNVIDKGRQSSGVEVKVRDGLPQAGGELRAVGQRRATRLLGGGAR